jgi:tetratricopeptide (TPR) repeat protein
MRPRNVSVSIVAIACLSMPALSQGNACLDTKDYVTAVKACSETILAGPKNAAAYHMRGTVLAKNGDTGQAIADYTKAIQINPAYIPAYNSRALAYTSLGDYTRAVADATMASELEAKSRPKAQAGPRTKGDQAKKAQRPVRTKPKTSSWASASRKEQQEEKVFNPFEGM